MAKFIYKMENILSIKNKLEEQAKTNYTLAQAKVNQEEAKLLNLKMRKDGYENQLREHMVSTLDILKIKICEDAIEIMKFEIKKQIIILNSAKQQLELSRIKLQEAMIERKTHDKLKDNAFEEFKEEIKAAENKEVDELNSFKYGNSNSGEED